MGSKQRSPNYPAIGLPDAVDLVTKIWNKEKRTPLSAESIAKTIGYQAASGTARTKISALNKYGLLERSGRQSKVSDLAVRIIHGQAAERGEALESAFAQVPLYAELVKSHCDASMDSLTSYLIVQKEFSQDGAKAAAEAFLASKSLVENETSGKMSNGDLDEIDDGNPGQPDSPVRHTRKHRTMPSDTKEDVFTLSAGDVVLQWPTRMSEDEHADLDDWLDLMKRKIKRTTEDVEPPKADDAKKDS